MGAEKEEIMNTEKIIYARNDKLAIARAIKEVLPQEQKEIAISYYYENFSIKDIAEKKLMTVKEVNNELANIAEELSVYVC